VPSPLHRLLGHYGWNRSTPSAALSAPEAGTEKLWEGYLAKSQMPYCHREEVESPPGDPEH
jgi:hypothetical protein